LFQTIQEGVNSEEFFAYAAGFDGERYIDLKLNQYPGSLDRSGLLVKVAVAKEQLVREMAAREQEEEVRFPAPEIPGEPEGLGTSGEREDEEAPVQAPVYKTRFFLSTRLDNTRINRDVQRLLQEVINHIAETPGAQVKVSLEVEASSTPGFPPTTIRTVSENSRTLGVDDFGFED